MLRALPVLVLLWMGIGATQIFVPHASRREPRSFVIVVSFWTLVIASSWAARAPAWLAATGAAGLFAALGLFQWAAHSIRGLYFSCAFSADEPAFLHTSGPYARIRNPFYTSYLLAIVSTAVMFPSPATALVAAAMIGYFNVLARFEERKFATSPLHAEYVAYMARTGRFLPRVRPGK